MPGQTAETLFFDSIFNVALQKKATDIHLMAGSYPVLRIHDQLFTMSDEKVLNVELLSSLVDAMATDSDKKRLEVERELRTVFVWANRARFRATIYYQQGYPAISFRVIPGAVPTPKEMMIPDIVVQNMTSSHGFILVSGPFSSGRTTMIASLIEHVNQSAGKRIVTFERPIEYVHLNARSLINQREVGKDTPTFIHGIQDALDSDVDLVVVSDLSEPGVEEMVITLAESGKLVLASMNATSAVSALEKFVDNIDKDKRSWAKDALATTLLAVMNLRLLPSVGGGRVIAAEVLTMTPATASIIQEERFGQLATIMQTSRDEGMVTLDVRLNELVSAGKISAESARIAAHDPKSIRGGR